MRPTKAQYDVAYKAAMKPGATDADKLALARTLSAACAEEVVSDIIQEPPFFTPSPAPIPPEAYHNASFPPITSDGIQEAAKRLRELRAQWDREDAEILAGLPMREPLPPRVPDLCPDDELRDLAKRVAPSPFFPNGAIGLVQEAIRRTGLDRRNVRVEWITEHATVKAFVSRVNAEDIDAIMEQAISMMPLGIGIDVQPETP